VIFWRGVKASVSELTATGTAKNQVEVQPAGEVATKVRYRILMLTFSLAFIMYLDRVCMGTAAPAIMKEFHLDKVTMGWSVSAFNWAYALFQIPGGWMADRFGARIVLAGALTWWSLFTAATGLSFNALSLAATRFLFGAGEAAAFPASSRAIIRWLPLEQRAFGQGFQHSGSRLGAALAPAIVVFLMAGWGWRSVFYIFGTVGVLCAAIWYAAYRNFPQEHPRVNAAELRILDHAGVSSHSSAQLSVPWTRILRSRDLWFLSLMYFCYGWVLWMYLFWLPTYLIEVRGYTQIKMGLGASLPLLAATSTNILGGWMSDKLTRRWRDLRRSRLTILVVGFSIAAAALAPGVLAESPVVSMAFLTLALAGLELTVPISWAISLDIGGDYSGSVSAIMNTLGNIGGALGAVCVGYLATNLGWNSPFFTASALCIFAALFAIFINPTRSAVNTSDHA
jgi:MFS family permease